MADPGPSITPSGRPTGRRLIKSTPMNRLGSASQAMSDGFRDLKVDSVAPYIANDIKSHQQVPVAVMLDVLLRRCLPKPEPTTTFKPTTYDLYKKFEPTAKAAAPSTSTTSSTKPPPAPGVLLQDCLKAVLSISNEPEFQDLLHNCCAKVDKETDRYSPLIELFNKALERLSSSTVATDLQELGLRSSSSLDILFHRSDPKEIIGSHGEFQTERKPDIVVVSLKDAQRAGFSDNQDGPWREFAYRYALKDPDDESSNKFQGFQWHDLLSVIEVKLARKQLTLPPAKFTVDMHYIIRATENVFEVPTTIAEKSEPEITSPTKGKGKGKGKAKAFVPQPLPVKVHETRARMAARAQPHSAPSTASKRSREQATSTTSSKRRKLDVFTDDVQEQTDATVKVPPPLIQSAMYGAEMLSRGIYATHALNSLIVDDVIWLWWYDRQGAIQSSGINFIQDWPYFMVLLVIFQRLDLQDWGIETKLAHADRRDTSPLAFEMPGNSDFVARIGGLESYFQFLSLTGRATHILAATSDSNRPGTKNSLTGIELALKSYWPELSRLNEAFLIAEAVKMSKTDSYIAGHLPDLLWAFELEYSTGTIRNDMNLAEDPQGTNSPRSKPRTLRFLLFRRLLPLNEVLGPKVFLDAWRQCYRCHFRLWKCGLEHGDISFNNLMWDDIAKKGVLNDFDLASLRGYPTINGERTGTIPFMALDLLSKEYFEGTMLRLYRHDLESFIWVFVWHCLKESVSHKQYVLKWQTSDFETCCDAKYKFIASYSYRTVIPGQQYHFLWMLARIFLQWLTDRRAARAGKDSVSTYDVDIKQLFEKDYQQIHTPSVVVEDADDVVFRDFERLLFNVNASFTMMAV